MSRVEDIDIGLRGFWVESNQQSMGDVRTTKDGHTYKLTMEEYCAAHDRPLPLYKESAVSKHLICVR